MTSDAARIAGLLTELGYPTTAEIVPIRLERMNAETGQHVLVAEDAAGRVVGLATVIVRHLITDEAPFARLSALVVAREGRRQGVGRALVTAAEQIAREVGCERMEVTSADRRADAHAFYVALGFQERPRRFVKHLMGQ